MKFNFKIDFKAETQSHYTTFPQTDQSRQIIARNVGKTRTIADNLAQEISSRATSKARNNFIFGKFNIFV